MNTELILGLDVGTSSIRAAVFDADLRSRPRLSVKIPHTPVTTPEGGSTFDADIVFSNLISAIDRVAAEAAKRKLVVNAVGSCAFWHGIAGVDERGRVTTPLLTWADRRSRDLTPILKQRFDEREIHHRTGAHFHSSFWPAKLMWFRREQPDVWRRTAHWLSFSDLVAMRLFDETVTSVSMASATGIFDQRKCDWDSELLRYLKIKRASLPRIGEDGETFQINRKYARRWPAFAKAKWFPAIGDGAADNIGSGCVTMGKVALMIGTSAAMRVAFEGEPPADLPRGLWCYRIDSKRVIVGGALSDGGNLYALIRERFRLSKDCDTLVAAREPDDDLVVIPFFFGERSIGYDETARGAIIGMTAGHDGIDVLRSAMEGIAFRLADIYERLETIAPINEIVASGGALRSSPAWQQIIADTLGRQITVLDADEASLRGAVLLALESIGKIERIESL